MTDVNIAVEKLVDAFEDRYDTALLISADSDLVGMVKSVLRLFPKKNIIIMFPPERYSAALHYTVKDSFIIGRKKLAMSIFPKQVTKRDGFVLEKPPEWKSL
jgi:uncharacterized LabA/DUF88 family protein